jgi:hypothetical protein
MFVRGERVMDIPKTYKGKFLGLNCLGHKKYEPDYCFASDVKSYIDEAQAEIDELVEWLRYEMEEAGADDKKDEAHNAKGAELLEKHNEGE